MAAWAPLSNFLSFLLPSRSSPPKLPPSQFPSSSSSSSLPSQLHFQNQKSIDDFAPLVVQNGQTHSEPLSAELASVICPSMAFSNTLYFRSTYNVQVVVEDNEPEERLLNRFRREVMRAGVIQECKRRKFFENKQDEKKRRTRDAAKRNRKRRPQLRTPFPKLAEASTSKKDDGEDNWDMPEVTPY